MEVVGGVSAVTALVEQSFKLLERIQMALEHNKEYAMHLTTVARDIENTKSVVLRVKNSETLQADSIKSTMEDILGLAKKLDELITKQESKVSNGAGFRLFAHSFAKGPKEQKLLEQLKNDLLQYKNTLIMCIVANLAPSGISLDVKGVSMDGTAILQNGRVIRTSEDKDFDRIVIRDVTMRGAAVMNNSAVTPEQQNKFLGDVDERAKMQKLLEFISGQGVEESIKQQIVSHVLSKY